MKLVIAEKPSVAQSIARVIGAAGRKDGYLEGNGYLVSWCVGHLVELSAPESYDERYSKWRLEDLPILPDSWLYQVSSGTKKQFGILKELTAETADQGSGLCPLGKDPQPEGNVKVSSVPPRAWLRDHGSAGGIYHGENRKTGCASLYEAERKENEADRKWQQEQER